MTSRVPEDVTCRSCREHAWAACARGTCPARRRRVRGIAAQSVFTALLLAAANIRKICAWRELTPADKTRIARRARRRRTSLRDYLPGG
jgi:hypothetical protein